MATGALTEVVTSRNNGDAEASLKRLNILKPSAIRSSLARSPKRIDLITRRSSDANLWVIPMFREAAAGENGGSTSAPVE